MATVVSRPVTKPAQEKVFALPELRDRIAWHLSRDSLASCSRVSAQWHVFFNPLLWKKVLFRVPQDFSRQGYLVQTLDLYMGSITTAQRDHIRHHCLRLRALHLHFQHLTPMVLQQLFEPTDRNGFVGKDIETLEIYAAEFSIIPSILPWLTSVRQKGYFERLQRLTLGNGQTLGTDQQVDVEDILEYLRVFPGTRMLCFGRIPVKESQRDSVQVQREGQVNRRWSDQGEDGIEKGDKVEGITEDDHHYDYRQLRNPETALQLRTYPVQELDIYPRAPSVLSRLLQRMPKLQKLCIRKIEDQEIIPIIRQGCPELKSFRYMGKGRSSNGTVDSNHSRDFDWHSLLSSYPWMETLVLENTIITDRTLNTITGFCSKRLGRLTLSMDAKIPTTALLQVLQTCEVLDWLQCTMPSISGELFYPTNDWVCCGTLRILRLFRVDLKGPEENASFRKRIRQLRRLEMLCIRGSGFMVEALLDQDDNDSTATVARRIPIKSDALFFLSPPSSPSCSKAIVPLHPSNGFRYNLLEDITMPKFEHVITLPLLKTLLSIMPRIEYINFHDGYDEEAREWLRDHRPNLDMGIVVWSKR
ncbi:MAG: hypothetical protein J3Q66DRAFT_341199 [Benniella sp.]|nr:MAG: hypothetical protein J3Q66DRAFT_341199 [Benniella sp.]